MMLADLKQKIDQKQAHLAVIGLGYVGLPVAAMFAEAGFDVLGIEIKPERVEKINAGISPIEGDEPGLAELLGKAVKSGKLHAAADYDQLKEQDVILIDVETPTDAAHIPQYMALRSALLGLGKVMQPGVLVIIESTIAPGTMRNLVVPILEEASGMVANQDFYLGNCPERVMPGKLLNNLRTLSRVAGGGTPETMECMIALYRNIVQADLDPADWVTAELVKTVENAYRDVQIAFANEVALICEAMGGDVWKVRELVNKSPFRQMHLPGAGVGGHCIPKDPWLLAYGVRDSGTALHIIPAARAVNDAMPFHVADLAKEGLAQAGVPLNDARILVMGYAYLENSDDTRNSPSEALVRRLKEWGAEVVIHDPFVAEYQADVLQIAGECDAVIVMVKHTAYREIDLNRLKNCLRQPVLIDGRRVFDPAQAHAAGFIFRSVGIG
jgi:UDP-N-acetyl-D-mannosaminuronic acid dehydrogenase